jgi:3-oxoacyl-[acyl-carrier-protein] synthase-3
MADFAITRNFLEDKIGVLERAVKQKGETSSDLCVKAFQDLQTDTNVDLAKIQLLAVVTQNPDLRIPHTAAIVHQKLGLGTHCMTFDISQACSGYIHALLIFKGLMETLHLDHALLFTSDPYSDIIDSRDRNTALLFGDAATVSYLTRTGAGYVITDAHFGTVPGSCTCAQCADFLALNGREVFSHAVREVPKSVQTLLDRNTATLADIDLFLLHQGSKLVVDYIKQTLAIPPEKAPVDILHYGNTASSSIPLLFQQPLRQQTHRKVICSGFGAGFSWGSCLLELSK